MPTALPLHPPSLSPSSSATARRWSDLDDPPPAPPRRGAHRGVTGEGRRKGRDGVGGLLPPPSTPPSHSPSRRKTSAMAIRRAVARQVVVVNSPGAPVGTLAGGYLNKVPLPRVPLLQSTAALMTGNRDTCYLQVPRIPTWSDLARSHLGAIRSTMLPLTPRWLM